VQQKKIFDSCNKSCDFAIYIYYLYYVVIECDARINVAYDVVQCMSITFVYCVETVKCTTVVAMECEYIGNRTQVFE